MRNSIEDETKYTQTEFDLGPEFKSTQVAEKEISQKKFIFLLNQDIKHVQNNLSGIDDLLIQINECIEADFIITYMTDDDANLGFKYKEKNVIGFDTNGKEPIEDISVTDTSVQEEQMSPITRASFLAIWLEVRKSYMSELNFLTDLYNEATILSRNNFSIRCFIYNDNELAFETQEKDPIGYISNLRSR